MTKIRKQEEEEVFAVLQEFELTDSEEFWEMEYEEEIN